MVKLILQKAALLFEKKKKLVFYVTQRNYVSFMWKY